MQILSAELNEDGNYVLVVKPLPQAKLSQSGDNVHVAGTQGWAEPLYLQTKDPDGKEVDLFATVDIRYRNPYRKQKKSNPLTAEDLRRVAEHGKQD